MCWDSSFSGKGTKKNERVTRRKIGRCEWCFKLYTVSDRDVCEIEIATNQGRELEIKMEEGWMEL